MFDIETIKIGLGAIAGVIWGAVGYAVAKKQGEDFDLKKFGKTVAIGFIVGLIAQATGINITTAENFTTVQLATILIDKGDALLEK